jgi:hydroxyacid-oxoacid transhydrogenase
MAGIGFGNAGVHLPHGMSYPVAGMVRAFRPDGYRVDHAIIPHGMSVILNTPAVVRFTQASDPERHLEAARALGADVRDAVRSEAGEVLRERIVHFMRTLGMPNGLAAVGYVPADIPALVEGTLPQHRVTKLSPRPADRDDLTALFEDSMRIWD